MSLFNSLRRMLSGDSRMATHRVTRPLVEPLESRRLLTVYVGASDLPPVTEGDTIIFGVSGHGMAPGQEVDVGYSVGGDLTGVTGDTGGSVTVVADGYTGIGYGSIELQTDRDNLLDGDKTLTLTLHDGAGYVIGFDGDPNREEMRTGEVVIQDDPPTLWFDSTSPADASMDEEDLNDTAEFVVHRSGGDMTQAVPFNLDFAGSADKGTDYTVEPGALEVTDSLEIRLKPKDDATPEGAEEGGPTVETITVTLGEGNYEISNGSQVFEATIVDGTQWYNTAWEQQSEPLEFPSTHLGQYENDGPYGGYREDYYLAYEWRWLGPAFVDTSDDWGEPAEVSGTVHFSTQQTFGWGVEFDIDISTVVKIPVSIHGEVSSQTVTTSEISKNVSGSAGGSPDTLYQIAAYALYEYIHVRRQYYEYVDYPDGSRVAMMTSVETERTELGYMHETSTNFVRKLERFWLDPDDSDADDLFEQIHPASGPPSVIGPDDLPT